MLAKLDEKAARAMLDVPETGMGYQIISTVMPHKKKMGNYIIYNGEIIADLDITFDLAKTKIANDGIQQLINGLGPTVSIDIEKTELHMNMGNRLAMPDLAKVSKSSMEGLYKRAPGNKTFVRVSPVEKDPRVDLENKKIKPGTFMAAVGELRETKPHLLADRYALPSDDKIRWQFFVRPEKDTCIQSGVVQPAFGNNGGAVEVYFEDGTTGGTLIDVREYGK